jgi:glycerophosphoryl diester phosphodiesterase
VIRRTGFPFLDEGRPVLAFAHRGGARHPDLVGRENTLAAFAHAVASGYRYLETDVHVTRDGVLVAFHDVLLDRVSDGVGSIADLDLGALRAVRVGGEPIPTLAEVVEAFPQAYLNLDLKSDAAVEPLAGFVLRHGLQDRILVGSFSWRRLARFRGLVGPRVPTSAAPAEVAAYAVLPARLARRTAPHVAALQIPASLRGVPLPVAVLVRRAHAVGVQVHVWTVDDADQMRRLLDQGVDGLMTDRTDTLVRVLTERGVWTDQEAS